MRLVGKKLRALYVVYHFYEVERLIFPSPFTSPIKDWELRLDRVQAKPMHINMLRLINLFIGNESGFGD